MKGRKKKEHYSGGLPVVFPFRLTRNLQPFPDLFIQGCPNPVHQRGRLNQIFHRHL